MALTTPRPDEKKKPAEGDLREQPAPAEVLDATFEEGAEPQPPAPLVAGDGELDEEDDEAELPAQIGYRKYVYAAFFCLGIALAYFFSKAGSAGWHRLSQLSSRVGEPREDWVTPIAAVIAAAITVAIYRRADVRQLADEVALELSKVEWPTREKVRRSTTIVVVATLSSAALFWIYDMGTNKAVSMVINSDHPFLAGLAAGAILYALRAVGSRYLMGKS